MNKQKVLLFGANGQLGFELTQQIAKLAHCELHALTREHCDLSQPSAVTEVIESLKPHIILNASAYTAVDKAENEPEAAYAVNAYAPAAIAQAAKKLGARLVHFSTDYVFDGNSPTPYTETDATAPQGVYGASKLAGERAVLESGCQAFVFRTAWVLGSHGGNFLKTMLRLGAQVRNGERTHLGVVADQIGSPTTTELIAATTLTALERGIPDGLYHLTASGRASWHEYTCYALPDLAAKGLIKPLTTAQYPTPAKRPSFSVLDCGKLEKALDIHLPDWRRGVDAVLKELPIPT